MKRKIVSLILITTTCLTFVACNTKEKEVKETVLSQKETFYDVSDNESDIYYKNENGVEFTKSQYENLRLCFSEIDIRLMPEETADSFKDNRNLAEVFNYNEDTGEKEPTNYTGYTIERAFEQKDFIHTKEEDKVEVVVDINEEGYTINLSRDEAIKRAKDEVDTNYDYIKPAIDFKNNVWRITLKEKEESKTYKQVYIGFDGITVGVADVTET